MIKMSCRKKMAVNSRKDAIIIPVYKNIQSLRQITGKKIDDELHAVLDSDYFNFENNEIRSFYAEVNKKLKKIYLLNIPREVDYPEMYRGLGAMTASMLAVDKIDSFSLIAFEDIYNEKKDFSATTSFMEGVLFSLYAFDRYKSKKEPLLPEEVEIITGNNRLKRYIDDLIPEWQDTFASVNMAKDLVNTPPNDLTPAIFADFINKNAHAGVSVEVMDAAKINEVGMGLVAAVGVGSANEPRFVRLTYKGAPESERNVALVGKGVTFDSGGTNLKPTGSMETMKSDMGGAAAVFATVNLIAARGLKVNVNGYIPLVENIIGGSAFRPGDIVKSLSGKTVEVLNTDAEGRLILADALYLATSTDPEVIVDMATLTGACVVALGEYCAGLFSNRKFLSKNISDISSKVGEDVWELPLYESYAEQLKSKNADLQNMGAGRNGGAILAALFLKEFVENYPWIHLDIAGPAFIGAKHPVFGKNASGFGIRLLYHFIKAHYTKQD